MTADSAVSLVKNAGLQKFEIFQQTAANFWKIRFRMIQSSILLLNSTKVRDFQLTIEKLFDRLKVTETISPHLRHNATGLINDMRA